MHSTHGEHAVFPEFSHKTFFNIEVNTARVIMLLCGRAIFLARKILRRALALRPHIFHNK